EAPRGGVVRDRKDGPVAGQQIEVGRRRRRDRCAGLRAAALAGRAVVAGAPIVGGCGGDVWPGGWGARDTRRSRFRATTGGRAGGAARTDARLRGAARRLPGLVRRRVERRERLAAVARAFPDHAGARPRWRRERGAEPEYQER